MSELYEYIFTGRVTKIKLFLIIIFWLLLNLRNRILQKDITQKERYYFSY